ADQGQGVETALAQLIAETLELPLAAVRIAGGDTLMTAVGRGTFASGGLAIAGETVLLAARRLAARITQLAAALWKVPGASVELGGGAVREIGGERSLALSELGTLMNYRQHLLPAGVDADPAVTVHASLAQPYL